jgi:hypothetical protein
VTKTIVRNDPLGVSREQGRDIHIHIHISAK